MYVFSCFNNISTSQFNQTNRVIHRQKLASRLIWNGVILRGVTKLSTVDQWVQYNKKHESKKNFGDIKTTQHQTNEMC